VTTPNFLPVFDESTFAKSPLHLSQPHGEMTRAASHLAIDESLLEAAEAGVGGELVRIWQFDNPVAILGRGSKFEVEIDAAQCERQCVPVLRRCSGGASIVAGPGCLMYSVVLSMILRPELRRLENAHRFVMQSLVESISKHLPEVRAQGTCDLTWKDRKFSGNSLRVARDHLLYHGTLLYDADLVQIAQCLRTPPRQPEYRDSRDHADFITNIPLNRSLLAACLRESFPSPKPPSDGDQAFTSPLTPPYQSEFVEFLTTRASKLTSERYSQINWTTRH
jgi:lipoate---protein ligase